MRLWWAWLTVFAWGCGVSSMGGPAARGLVLGVEPVPGPDDAGLPATELIAYVGGFNASGGLTLPEASDIALTCASNGPCTASGEGVQRPGAAEGVLAIILDNSCSNGASPSTCVGCPTDPKSKRADGIRELIRRLLGRAPAWRVAFFDFGSFPNGGRLAANLRAGYSSFPDDFEPAIKAITANGSTFVYDSMVDVLPTLQGERLATAPMAPARLLIVSDGEDTSSQKTLADGLALARQYGVTVDTVGYGQRGDAGTVVLAPRAYRDLRRIASETGGFCTVVAADELPALFSRIGELYVAGYAERRFTLPSANGPVSGEAGLSGGALSPFLFEDYR